MAGAGPSPRSGVTRTEPCSQRRQVFEHIPRPTEHLRGQRRQVLEHFARSTETPAAIGGKWWRPISIDAPSVLSRGRSSGAALQIA